MKVVITFLILNYKSYDDTINAVDGLLQQIGSEASNCRILVVDNSSPNDSFSILKSHYSNFPLIEIIQSPTNGGYARGNNYGLYYMSKYDSKYVCIMNNDVYFDIKQVWKLISIYESLSDIAIISPIQRNLEGKFVNAGWLERIPSFWDDLKNYLFIRTPVKSYSNNCIHNGLMQVEMIPGAFFLINYSLFESLGFFDNRTFLFGEERLLAKKIKDSGLKNYIVLDEIYKHAHSKTIDSEASKIQQAKYIFDSIIIYTKEYSSFPVLKTSILYVAYNIYMNLRKLSWKIKMNK